VLGARTDHGRGQFYVSGESQSPKLPFFRRCPQTLFPSAASLVDEVCPVLRLAYPPGKRIGVEENEVCPRVVVLRVLAAQPWITPFWDTEPVSRVLGVRWIQGRKGLEIRPHLC
jgi:hypothetical protein